MRQGKECSGINAILSIKWQPASSSSSSLALRLSNKQFTQSHDANACTSGLRSTVYSQLYTLSLHSLLASLLSAPPKLCLQIQV